jgi:hypothetical protein
MSTKIVNGFQILTGSLNDSVTLGAPTLGQFTSFSASGTLASSQLVNNSNGLLSELWSNSSPFVPFTQINLSFTSNKGSTLDVSRTVLSPINPSSYDESISLVSGNKNITLNANSKNSFPQLADANGKFISGVATYSGYILYQDNKGTQSVVDDVTSYFIGSGSNTYDSATQTLKVQGNGTTYYATGKYNLYAILQNENNSSVNNSSGAPSFTFLNGSSQINQYVYWTNDGFSVQFSGTSSVKASDATNTFSLKNVTWTDYVGGYQIKAALSNFVVQNSSPTNPNFGVFTDDDISGVRTSLTTNFLQPILNSGVTVTALNTTGAILKGGLLADIITGGAGGDTITAGGANDKIDGGAGINTAVYSGKFTDYTVTTDGNGTYTVTDTVNNRDGVDTLTNIQFLTFSDANKAIADVVIKAGPNLPTLSAPAILNLAASSTTNIQSWFTAQPAKGGAPVDLYIFYDAGSGANSGHINVTNAYIMKNDAWSLYSGEVPALTLVAVSAAGIGQVTYTAPKIVGLNDDIYAGVAANGQWSTITHTLINT